MTRTAADLSSNPPGKSDQRNGSKGNSKMAATSVLGSVPAGARLWQGGKDPSSSVLYPGTDPSSPVTADGGFTSTTSVGRARQARLLYL